MFISTPKYSHKCLCQQIDKPLKWNIKRTKGICSRNSTYLVNDDRKVIQLEKSVSLKRGEYD
jgi:hypothetical protein